jgi:anti-anti-sigma factor
MSDIMIESSAVTFIDSSILGALIRVSRAADERGKAFALRRPAPLVLRLLRITGLDDRFQIEQ